MQKRVHLFPSSNTDHTACGRWIGAVDLITRRAERVTCAYCASEIHKRGLAMGWVKPKKEGK